MLNSIRKLPLLPIALLLLIGFPVLDAHADGVVLPVPLIGQQTEQWCWATTLQMSVMNTGVPVSQCSQANARFGRNDCCNTPTPAACIQPGWPDYNWANYNSARTAWGAALTYAQLKAEIQAGRPVNFSWAWVGGGGHIMVAIGFGESESTQNVFVNDPWPVNSGELKVITYAEYVRAANNHEHGQDYFGISSKQADRYYTIKSKKSGMVLSVEGASTSQGAKMVQVPASGGDQEKWKFIPVGDHTLVIKNKKSGMVLKVEEASTNQGAPVIQGEVPQFYRLYEEWLLDPTADGYFIIRNWNSEMVLNVEGGSTSQGAHIIQWPRSGVDHEKWQLEQVP